MDSDTDASAGGRMNGTGGSADGFDAGGAGGSDAGLFDTGVADSRPDGRHLDGAMGADSGADSGSPRRDAGTDVIDSGAGAAPSDGGDAGPDTADGGVCGNDFVDTSEACDDGNTRGGDTCTADCSAQCTNIATEPDVTASSSGGGTNQLGPEQMNDGRYNLSCDYHWINAPSTPDGDWIELEWPSEVTIHSIFVDTYPVTEPKCGQNEGRTLAGGDLQWWDGESYNTVDTVRGKTDDWWLVLSSPVTTTRLRLMNVHATDLTGAKQNPLLFEWEVFRCE